MKRREWAGLNLIISIIWPEREKGEFNKCDSWVSPRGITDSDWECSRFLSFSFTKSAVGLNVQGGGGDSHPNGASI